MYSLMRSAGFTIFGLPPKISRVHNFYRKLGFLVEMDLQSKIAMCFVQGVNIIEVSGCYQKFESLIVIAVNVGGNKTGYQGICQEMSFKEDDAAFFLITFSPVTFPIVISIPIRLYSNSTDNSDPYS